MIFLSILFSGAVMDMKEKALDNHFLAAAGLIGIFYGGISGFDGRDFYEIILSSGIGILILLLGRITGGGIGEGDGWFFVISGLFLNIWENIVLFMSGLSACSIYSLGVIMISFFRGKQPEKSFPFLPFLIPGGVWLICIKG